MGLVIGLGRRAGGLSLFPRAGKGLRDDIVKSCEVKSGLP
jgi:hypothetical protein